MIKLIIKNPDGSQTVREVSNETTLTPSAGQQFYFDNVAGRKYTFNLADGEESIELVFLDANGERITLNLKGMADLIRESDTALNEASKTVLGIMDDTEGMKELNETALNPDFQGDKVISELKDLLADTTQGEDYQNGIIIDDFGSLAEKLDAAAAGGENSNTGGFTFGSLDPSGQTYGVDGRGTGAGFNDPTPPSGNPDTPNDTPDASVDGTVAVSELLVDESPLSGDGIRTATADYSTNFGTTVDFGNDGPGNVVYTFSLTGTNVATGLENLDGEPIVMNFVGGEILGTVGDVTYFTISNVGTTLTFSQNGNIKHSDTTDHDDVEILNAPAGSILLTQTITDSDGDTDSASLDLSQNVFKIEDDGPSVTTEMGNIGAEDLVVDDSDLSATGKATANYADNFTAPVFDEGNDTQDRIDTSYTLGIKDLNGANVESGLIDSQSGEKVILSMDGTNVVGKTESGELVFTVSVDENGTVTLDQDRAIKHDNVNDHEETGLEAETLSAADLVTLTREDTIYDKDGDSVSSDDTIEIGTSLKFEDDGPSVTTEMGNIGAEDLVVDDSDLSATGKATANYADNFTAPVFDEGNDTQDRIDTSYTLGIKDLNGANVESGLIDSQSGEKVILSMDGTNVVGKTESGELVFTVSVDENGTVTLDQDRAIKHDNVNDHEETGLEAETLSAADLVTLTREDTIYDKDGDSVSSDDTIEIGTSLKFEDDGPSVTTEMGNIGAEDLVVDDSDLSATGKATANYADNFTAPVFDEGNDTQDRIDTSYTLGIKDLNGANVESGLIDSQSGEKVILSMDGTNVVGKTESGELVFTVSVDENGTVTLDQDRAIKHDNVNDHEETGLEAETLSAADLVTLTREDTIYDKDGDSVSSDDTIEIGTSLKFEDDGPSVTTEMGNIGAEDLVVDDSDLSATGKATANYADNFTAPVFDEGNDTQDRIDTSYTLGIKDLNGANVESGLIDSQSGEKVILSMDGTNVVGKTESGELVFTVSVDENGTVTLDQDRAIKHDNVNDHEETGLEAETLSAADLVTLTREDTIYDKDGDSVSSDDTIEIGTSLKFEDDGPSVTTEMGNIGAEDLVVDDSDLSATGKATANYADNFTAPVFDEGNDTQDRIDTSYTLGIKDLNGANVESGLIDSQSGEKVILSMDGTNVVGKTESGELVFTVSVDENGTVTLDQDRAIKHDNVNDHEETGLEAETLSAADLVTLTREDTIYDKDGDSVSSDDTIEIGTSLKFEDDGPSVTTEMGNIGAEDLVVDDSDLSATGKATANYADNFTAPVFDEGNDTQDRIDTSYTLGIKDLNGANVESGLIDSQSGEKVILSMDGTNVVGKTESGELVFTVSVDENGTVTLDQDRAIKHDNVNDHEETGLEAETLSAADLVTLTREDTIYDKDGDSVSSDDTIEIGTSLKFEDDGPSVTTEMGNIGAEDLVVDDSDLSATGKATANYADNFTAPVFDEGNDTQDRIDTSYTLGIKDLNGANVESGLIDSQSGEKVILSMDGTNVVGKTESGELVFTVSVDENGTVTLDQDRAIKHDNVNDHEETGLEAETLSAADLVTLTREDTIYDKDGDSVSSDDTIEIGTSLKFEDDGPSVTTEMGNIGAEDLVVDDSDLSATGKATANYADNFTAPVFDEGNDTQDRIDTSYTLGIKDLNGANVESGLIDSQSGEKVILSMDGTNVVGKTESGELVFTVSVDENGTVTLDQDRAIKHDNVNDHEETGLEAETLSAADLVTLTREDTIYDKDGDSVSSDDTIEIGTSLKFEDDGPSVTTEMGNIGAEDLVVDDSDLSATGKATANYADNFTAPVFDEGNDTQDRIDTSYTLGIKDLNGANVESGLIDSQSGEKVILSMDGTNVVGKTESGELVFTVSVDENGTVTLDQDRAIKHDNVNDHEETGLEAETLSAADLVTLTREDTIYDKDGDSVSSDDTIEIGTSLKFEDDGPSVIADSNTKTTIDNSQFTNLVVNGSFENVTGQQTSHNKDQFVENKNLGDGKWIGLQSMEGWQLLSKSSLWMEPHDDNHAGIGTADGENYMDLGETNSNDSDADNTHIGQILCLEDGITYDLKFAFKDKAEHQANNDASGKMEVYFDGNLIAIVNGNTVTDGEGNLITTRQDTNSDWEYVTLQIVGGSDTSENRLEFKEVGTGNDNWGMALDDISVSASFIEYEGNLVSDNGITVDFGEDGKADGTGIKPDGDVTAFSFATQSDMPTGWTVSSDKLSATTTNGSTITIDPNTGDYKLVQKESLDVGNLDFPIVITDGDGDSVKVDLNFNVENTPECNFPDTIKVLIDNDTVTEGDTLGHKLTLVDANGAEVRVPPGKYVEVTLNYAPASHDGAESSDYTAQTTVRVYGGTSGTFIMNDSIDDNIKEKDESYIITVDSISSDIDIKLDNTSPDTAIGTIIDNDVEVLSITPDTVTEGEVLTHTVTLTGVSVQEEVYDFSIANDTATSPEDYLKAQANLVFSHGVTYDSSTGKITVPIGVTTFTVSVPSVENKIDEDTENYNIIIDGKSAEGIILDDDIAPEAKDDTKTIYEDGREFRSSEDEIVNDEATSVSGNVITNDKGTNPLTITKVVFSGNEYTVPQGDNTSLTIDTPNGSITIDKSGAYTYTIDEAKLDSENVDYNVSEDFTYTLNDGFNPDSSADLTVNIKGSNDAPEITFISGNEQSLHIIDGLLDINGDNNADPLDLTNDDDTGLVDVEKGMIFTSDNGDLNINLGQGETDLEVSFNGGQAGFKNVIGYYTADENGNPLEAHIIFVDSASANGYQDTALNVLENLTGNVGFFIIPNGSTLGVTSSSTITFDNNGKMLVDNVEKPVYYTDNNLNEDGEDHVVASKSEEGDGIVIAFEDKELGDQDYDDVVLTIKPCATLGTPTETTLFVEDFEGINKGSGDTNISSGWYVDHGTNGDDVLVSNDAHNWEMNQSGIEVRANGGVHGLNTANGSDTYVELDAHTRGTNSKISTDVNLGESNDVFKLTFDYTPRPGAEDSSDMKLTFAGIEVEILSDAQGNVSVNAPLGVEVSIEPNGAWNEVTVKFSNVPDNIVDPKLSFESTGTADTLGAYLDNIKLVGQDYSTSNTILTDISLKDVDNENLTEATVTLTNYRDGDVLSVDTALLSSLGLTTSQVTSNGETVLTISGVASKAEYEKALEAVKFNTSSDESPTRDFEFVVFDGNKHSNEMPLTVNISGCALNTYTPPVFVKITQDDVAAEGDELTHKIELFYKDGTPAIVPEGESVTVQLNYSGNVSNNDFVQNGKTTSVTISAGTNTATITNQTKDDHINENDESYTVSVGTITTDAFGNISAHQTENSAEGTIIDYDKLVVEDNSNTQEDGSWNVSLFKNSDAIFINDENNGSTYESITISGIPDDAVLKDSNGSVITVTNGQVTLTDDLDAIRGITITPAKDSSENIYLTHTITSKDDDNNSYTDAFNQTVRIEPDADAPDTQGNKSYTGLEGTWIPLTGLFSNITETNENGHANETLYTRVQIIEYQGSEPSIDYKYTKDDGTVVEKTAKKGWIEVPQDALDTLEIKTNNADFNGDIQFKLQTRARDNDELNDGEKTKDDAWETDLLTVSISGDADAPILSMRTSGGLEDAGRDNNTGVILDGKAGIPIELDASTSFGSESIEFIISDIPADAYLFDKNGNQFSTNTVEVESVDSNGNTITHAIGSVVVITLAQAQGLTIVPPHDSNVDFDLTVVGKSTETNYDVNNGGLETNFNTPQTLTVQLKGVIDSPVIETSTVGGDEDSWVSFGLKVASGEEQHLSETLFATLENIPKDAQIRIVDSNGNSLDIDSLTLAGVNSDKSINWRIDNDLLQALNNGTKDIQILPPKDFSGELEFGLEVTARENDGDSTTVRENFVLDINPVVDTADKNLTQSVNEDTWTELSLPWNTADITGSETVTSAKIVIPDHIDIKINGVEVSNNGSEISISSSDTVEILAPLHSNVDFNGIVFTREILDDSTHDSNLDSNDETATKTVITNISIDMKGIADGWDTDSYDGFQVQDIPLVSSPATVSFESFAYQGDSIIKATGNPNNKVYSLKSDSVIENTAHQDVYENNGKFGVFKQASEDLGLDKNETLLFKFSADENGNFDLDFSLEPSSGTGSFDGQYFVFDSNHNLLSTSSFDQTDTGSINVNASGVSDFVYVVFDANTSHTSSNNGAADPGYFVKLESINNTTYESESNATNEETSLNEIITKNVTVEDEHDINDASEAEYYIVKNNDTDNTSWTIVGGINAGNGTWIIPSENLDTAKIKIHSLVDGDGTLDLKIIPVTVENDGHTKFDEAHEFNIAYGDGSENPSYSGEGASFAESSKPTLTVTSGENNGLEDNSIVDTDFETSATVTTTTVGEICPTAQDLGELLAYLNNQGSVDANVVVQLAQDQNGNPKQDQNNLELDSLTNDDTELLLYDNISNQNATRDLNSLELSGDVLDVENIATVSNTVNNTYNMTSNQVIFEGNIVQNGNVHGTSSNDVIIVKGEVQGGSNINGNDGNDLIAIMGDIGNNNPAIDGGNGVDILYLSKPASKYIFQEVHFHDNLDGKIIDKDTGNVLVFNNIEGIAFGDGSGLNCDVNGGTSTTVEPAPMSYVVTGVENGNLSSKDGFYELPNGDMVTINKELVDNITPTADFNGELNIDVTVVATNTNNGAESTNEHEITVDVNPVADTSSVSANDGIETNGEAINLNLSISSGDKDGSEVLTGDVKITPTEGTLSGPGVVDNGDGSYTVPAASLLAVMFTPPPYTHGKFDFDISYTMKDEDKFASGDDVITNVDKSFSIDLASQVDEVSVDLVSNTVDEGQELPLGLTLNQADSDGSEIASVIITGLPEGAKLDLGTIRTLQDGTKEFVLKANEVADAKVIADENYSGTFTVTAKALSYDKDSGEIFESTLSSKEFSITPVADNLTVNADGFAGNEGESISIKLDLVLEDVDVYSDTKETVNVVFTNYEAGSKFTIDGTTAIGIDDGAGNYVINGLTPEQAENLAIIPPAYFDGEMNNVQVAVKTQDGADILANAQTDTFSIRVNAVTDEASLTINDMTADRIEGTNTYSLDIDASVPDADQSLEIVLSNVQGTLNNGSCDISCSDSGEWKLTLADLDGLIFTPASDAPDSFNISVKAVTKDGNDVTKETTAQTISVEVENVSLLDADGEIDLSTIITDDTRNALDSVDMTNGNLNDLNINLDDIVDLTDTDNELKIFGDSGDNITLEGGDAAWDSDGTRVIDGETFNVYKGGTPGTSNIKILIDEDVSIDPDL